MQLRDPPFHVVYGVVGLLRWFCCCPLFIMLIRSWLPWRNHSVPFFFLTVSILYLEVTMWVIKFSMDLF